MIIPATERDSQRKALSLEFYRWWERLWIRLFFFLIGLIIFVVIVAAVTAVVSAVTCISAAVVEEDEED